MDLAREPGPGYPLRPTTAIDEEALMGGRLGGLGAVVALVTFVVACGGGGGGGGGGGADLSTDAPRATLPPDLPIVSCYSSGPFTTTPCSGPIETIFAQVNASGPFEGVRVTTVGVNDCAAPRTWPDATPRPTLEEWHWMVRFENDGVDYGGFVGTGGRLGEICIPFTGL